MTIQIADPMPPATARPAIIVSTPEVAGLGTVLGVWAHPDDEVYTSGGIMAAAAQAGNRVVVVTATRGEAGTDDPARWPPSRLAPLRTSELTASLTTLGGGQKGRIEHRFLGERTPAPRSYLDGGLERCGPEQVEEAVSELAELIAEIAPDTILTFGPDGLTGHRDHRTVSAWTGAAVRRLGPDGPRVLHATQTVDWVREFGDVVAPMDDGDDLPAVTARAGLAIDLTLRSQDLDTKVAALWAQASQTRPLERLLGTERYRAFVAAEAFRPAESRDQR